MERNPCDSYVSPGVSHKKYYSPRFLRFMENKPKLEPKSPDFFLQMVGRKLSGVVVLSRSHVRLESFDRALP